MTLRILVRGGGDLASGVIVRLHRSGWQVLVTELERPLAVRRYVAFAQAVYADEMRVEEVRGRKVQDMRGVEDALAGGCVPVLVDPQAAASDEFRPHVLVDGRMRKLPPEIEKDKAPLTIGLGPGFTAGFHCHAVIETNRGPHLGRVIWQGGAEENTGIPERVGEHRSDRVLRSPVDGSIDPMVEIGTLVQTGAVIARVAGQPVTAPFPGVLRGIVQAGLMVAAGEKIGDLDPRADPGLCWLVSDKALSVGGGVLEAILSWRPLRGWR
jgi:xanthine dehydrogenase accessory factor